MNLNGEHRIAATRERVWRAMRDTDTLRQCIPGCEDVQSVDKSHFNGRLMTRMGAVSTVFSGQVLVSDERFPKQWRVAGHAESPSAGWADGTADIGLAEVPGGTVVSYRLNLQPGGRLAAMGDRLLRGVAMRMANDFFTRLTERLMPEPPDRPPANDPVDRSDAAATPPRRVVLPLTPTPPAAPAASAARSGSSAGAAPAPPQSRAQRIIITVGWVFCAFILLALGYAMVPH